MPLLQKAISEVYGRPLGEIEIGAQELSASSLETVKFSIDQLADAEKDFKGLGEVVRHYDNRIG